jgi:hypothetical protein
MENTGLPPLIDAAFAPEIFATEVVGFWLLNGNVHLTLATGRSDYSVGPGKINRVVIGRLILPVSGAQGLAAGLYDFLKKHGFDPVPTPPKEQMQ